jgi:hypothetical protein
MASDTERNDQRRQDKRKKYEAGRYNGYCRRRHRRHTNQEKEKGNPMRARTRCYYY